LQHGWNPEQDPARGANKGQKASLRLSDRRAGVGNTKQVPFADWKHVPVLGVGAVCQLIRAVSGGVISRYRRSAAAINFDTANFVREAQRGPRYPIR